jgi:hypothetical protein
MPREHVPVCCLHAQADVYPQTYHRYDPRAGPLLGAAESGGGSRAVVASSPVARLRAQLGDREIGGPDGGSAGVILRDAVHEVGACGASLACPTLYAGVGMHDQ